MKKFLPITLVGVAVLGLAVGGWFFIKGRGDVEVLEEAGSLEGQLTGEEEDLSVSGKIEDLLSLGKAVKCTWQDVENNTGVAYVKGDKVYTEATTNGVKSYYISRDNCTYMWQEGEPNGYKICVEPEEAEEETETQMPEGFSVNTGMMNYNCVPQVINDTRFEAPTDIEFMDFAQMMQMSVPNMTGN
ncbi:hypothetical protein MUP65_01075 [Patescibacteria group bacterium]|nr:hypothetical protein [Patescibacteria group bacterium]